MLNEIKEHVWSISGELDLKIFISLQEVRKVTVWAEKVFRGHLYPQLIELYSASYKADYRLVPKEEEKALWDRVSQTKLEEKVIPEYAPFPPLMKVCLFVFSFNRPLTSIINCGGHYIFSLTSIDDDSPIL